MSIRDHVVADSDLHVMEPPDLWQRYIDPAFRHAAPQGLSEMKRDMRVRVKSRVLLRMGSVRPQRREEGRRAGWRTDHDEVYAESEARGWDAPSPPSACSAPAWLHPTMSTPQSPRRSAASRRWASRRCSSRRARSTAGPGTTRSTTRSGPRLSGWAPWLFHRLDEHYDWVGGYEAPDLTMKPSEYFRRNCFLSVEADEEPARQYIEWFGDENLVFSTDYPHGDSKYPHAVEAFAKLPIPEVSQIRILGQNWSRLYDIPLRKLAPRG